MSRARTVFGMVVLYGLLPAVFCWLGRWGVRLMIPALWVGAGLCLRALRRDGGGVAWNAAALKTRLPVLLLRWLAGGSLLAWGMHHFRPEQFLSLPRQDPWLWAAIGIGYPLLSVLPQEVIYRAHFFARLERAVPGAGGWPLILLNAAVFGYAHLAFGQAGAMVWPAAGGVLFASTYAHTRSLACASLEHALWGVLVFTLGLGTVFQGGTVAGLLGR